LKDGFVAVVVGELDLDCAVVEEFGGSFASTWSPSSLPC
jgi:hypothetical protein